MVYSGSSRDHCRCKGIDQQLTAAEIVPKNLVAAGWQCFRSGCCCEYHRQKNPVQRWFPSLYSVWRKCPAAEELPSEYRSQREYLLERCSDKQRHGHNYPKPQYLPIER